jgi:hypothetical protein
MSITVEVDGVQTEAAQGQQASAPLLTRRRDPDAVLRRAPVAVRRLPVCVVGVDGTCDRRAANPTP